MKKLIAVSAGIIAALTINSVSAAELKADKISVSDLLVSVNEIKQSCASGLIDCIFGGDCENLFDGKLDYDSLRDYIGNIFDKYLPEKDEEQLPEQNPEQEETPDVEQKPEQNPEEKPENKPEQKPDEKPEETPDSIIPPTDNDTNTGGGYVSNDAYVNEVLRLVNSYRAKNGLAAVTLDSSLCNAAQIRAQETKSSFSHTRPNGSSCFTVLSELGISYNGAGENIAYGQSSPEEVMTAWMNSEGHRANILGASFTKLGVGVYSSGGTIYWAQMFTY